MAEEIKIKIVSPKDKIHSDKTPSVIYHFQCKDCGQHYIGESCRGIHTRIKEHKDSVRLHKPDSSAVGSHVYDTGHSIDWNNASVISKDSNSFSRKFKEAILIKASDPGLNRNKGVEVPAIWWPLLLKRQNLPRVSTDIGIQLGQGINTSQPRSRPRSLTSARDLTMGGRPSRN